LSENQHTQLQFLTKANPTLYRAYLLKENLRLALKAGPDEIASALKVDGLGAVVQNPCVPGSAQENQASLLGHCCRRKV